LFVWACRLDQYRINVNHALGLKNNSHYSKALERIKEWPGS
jgi:hypothetical protein